MVRSFWTSFLGRQFRLGGRKERRVLDLIAEHLSMVQRCVREIRKIVDSIEQANWALVRDQAEIVSRYEKMADDLHREAVVQIAQGAFFAGMREDFLNLVERVDEIADACQDAARILSEVPMEPDVVEYVYTGDPTIRQFAEGIDKCVATLAESVECLRTNAESAVAKALEVENVEEAVDQIKSALVSRLSAHRHEIDVLAYLQIKESIFKLDDVADAAENSSDLVITIVVKAIS